MTTNPGTPWRFPLRLLAAGALVSLVALLVATEPSSSAQTRSEARHLKAGTILWSKLAVRAQPAPTSAVVTVLRQFRRDFRPTTVLVLGERKVRGERWLRVSLAMRPNGRTGWARADAVHTRPVRRTIVIDLSARKLRVLEAGRTRFATKVAIGRPGMETPVGRFYVTAAFRPKERFFGSFAFETSAYAKVSDWPGGGLVGIHGTSMPSLLGKAVSHGCVRVSNAAALRLKRLAQPGTPVRIVR